MEWRCVCGVAWEDVGGGCEDPQDARRRKRLRSKRLPLPRRRPRAFLHLSRAWTPIGSLARSLGFAHVSKSAQLLLIITMAPRGLSSAADAYLA
ncbi:uncharacterized protein LACBIDRAFT_301916 [Laccaria bicolor S238N-H82]|uniref:Predicted protein n=1 Tax=Laccaria bicolor (strain S238N-H82 / ATCC MYA-4686) TaxID=486041 RepID=B0CPX0_LACBS|nr:uncharacterized protein LACBIDRAFT_301916 [Laccaria bicolor S238N-H82]EDR16139.1 predicted protein [Laccaria bicolor S238N-H82]|eukprot:XP_001874347.1 predicted protein [Laccaria bicolor S238N-H82]